MTANHHTEDRLEIHFSYFLDMGSFITQSLSRITMILSTLLFIPLSLTRPMFCQLYTVVIVILAPVCEY